MEVVFKNDGYLDDIDILCRVYKNQDDNCPENEQIASEVLFKPHMDREHSQALSWLPQGAAHHIVEVLNTVQGQYKVQVSNELTDNIGVLTSCRDNFTVSREWEKLKTE